MDISALDLTEEGDSLAFANTPLFLLKNLKGSQVVSALRDLGSNDLLLISA